MKFYGLLGAFGILLSLIAVLGGCTREEVLGGIDKPDIDLTIITASNLVETGEKPELLYKLCEKQTPIVTAMEQKWFCHFGFRTRQGAQDCAAIVSAHADDHMGVWKPDNGKLNLATGVLKPNLVCSSRRTAS